MVRKVHGVLAGACLGLGMILAVAAAARGGPATAPAAGAAPAKKLIAWGGLDWYSPATVQQNIGKFEELPFNGMVLAGLKATKGSKEVSFDWEFFGKKQFDPEDLAQTREVLRSIRFHRFTDNFLRFNVTPGDVDWFDDFSSILHNARVAAELAKETGMKGWMFDLEDYQSIKDTVFSYKRKKYAKKRSFEEYAKQAQLRGRQFIEAVQEAYPDITLMLTFAQSYLSRTPHAPQRLAEMDEYSLLPAFVNGLIEGAGPGARIIDGHEQAYGYQTPEEFFRGYHSAKQQALELVPQELWGKYRARMETGMAIYVDYVLAMTEYPGWWPTHYMTPEDRLRLLEQDVYYALTAADEYAWFYCERPSWWEKGKPFAAPEGTMDAVRSAAKKAAEGEPLGFDMAAVVSAARAAAKRSNPWPTLDSPLVRIPAGQAAPGIDGVLSDSVWKQTKPLHPFAPLRGGGGMELATAAQAVFDDEHLYIAFRCEEPEKPTIAGSKRDDAPWKGDCVEVVLKSPEEAVPPFHFIVNPSNVQWDGRGDLATWNAEWQSAARLGEREWTVEIGIPWKAIGGRPGSGSVLAELCRRRAASNDLTAVVQNLTVPAAAPAK